MATIQTTPVKPLPAAPQPPPLQPGDRLSRAEFERRFDATPGLKKAELIEGIVYMPPPVAETFHGSPHADLLGLLFYYRAMTPGVIVGDNSSLRLDLDNMPQPDGYVRIARGGTSKTDKDGYVEGPPELITEVSASSASYDLHDKLGAYRRNGVKEYVVWRVYDSAIDWFVLRGGQYVQLKSDKRLLKSKMFSGLWLNPSALIRGDAAGALRTLQEGIASPEHAAFVVKLRELNSTR